MSQQIVISDIDGTISDHTMRKHLAERSEWDEYHHLLQFDEPHRKMVQLLCLLATRCEILLFTGRPVEYERITVKWLETYGVPYNRLYMRPVGNRKPSSMLKLQYLNTSLSGKFSDVLVAFDDRDRDVAMYRNQGIYCHQVNYGSF